MPSMVATLATFVVLSFFAGLPVGFSYLKAFFVMHNVG